MICTTAEPTRAVGVGAQGDLPLEPTGGPLDVIVLQQEPDQARVRLQPVGDGVEQPTVFGDGLAIASRLLAGDRESEPRLVVGRLALEHPAESFHGLAALAERGVADGHREEDPGVRRPGPGGGFQELHSPTDGRELGRVDLIEADIRLSECGAARVGLGPDGHQFQVAVRRQPGDVRPGIRAVDAGTGGRSSGRWRPGGPPRESLAAACGTRCSRPRRRRRAWTCLATWPHGSAWWQERQRETKCARVTDSTGTCGSWQLTHVSEPRLAVKHRLCIIRVPWLAIPISSGRSERTRKSSRCSESGRPGRNEKASRPGG